MDIDSADIVKISGIRITTCDEHNNVNSEQCTQSSQLLSINLPSRGKKRGHTKGFGETLPTRYSKRKRVAAKSAK